LSYDGAELGGVRNSLFGPGAWAIWAACRVKVAEKGVGGGGTT